MTDLFEQLQNVATDPQIPVSTLLQKAVLVANRRNDHAFSHWAKRELNGYNKADPHVEFRNLKGGYAVLTSEGQIRRIVWDDSTRLKSRLITLPLPELESLVAGDGNSFAVKIDLDPTSLTSLTLEVGDTVVFTISRSTLVSFLFAIRQYVLDWTMRRTSRIIPRTTEASDMLLTDKERWLLRYLDAHCESPDESGMIDVDRHWATAEESKKEHGKALASGLAVTCDQLEGLVSGLRQRGLIGKIRSSDSLMIWITAEGQDTVRSMDVPTSTSTARSEGGHAMRRRIGVMIGSPGDTSEERQAITDAIVRWNAAHGSEKRILLEPVRWETHATPGLQGRPQEMINEELGANSDCLIAVFRGRAGTPTGSETSGTIEEIRRFMRAGKYVAVYFYTGPVPLPSIDPVQLAALNDFKTAIRKDGLTDDYASVSELAAKLANHLTAIVAKVASSSERAKEAALLEVRSTLASGLISIIISGEEFDQRALNPWLDNLRSQFSDDASALRELAATRAIAR